MPRPTFERELQKLQDALLVLGSMVERAILQSVDMLKRRDLEGSRRLISDDLKINQKRFAIESDCLTLIATQQPMATDLRSIAAILELATELERMGDYGKGIARVTLMMGEKELRKPIPDFRPMAEKACSMLHRALGAFVRQDVELARVLPKEDDEVDEMYNKIYSELLSDIVADPDMVTQSTQLLWVAHNLERAADRVTNICERVIFTGTGRMMEMDMEAFAEPELGTPPTV